MNKSIKWLMVLIFTSLLVTACAVDKNLKTSHKELTISYKELTEKENQLINHSGGVSGQHFILNGDIPDNHILELTIEQYEKGELINGEPNTLIEGEDYEGTGEFSFVVGTASSYGSDKAIIGLPGGSITLSLENIVEGGAAYGVVTQEKVIPKLNEPIYLAYWVSTANGNLSTPNFFEVDTPDMKKYDNGFLFKVELKEK